MESGGLNRNKALLKRKEALEQNNSKSATEERDRGQRFQNSVSQSQYRKFKGIVEVLFDCGSEMKSAMR